MKKRYLFVAAVNLSLMLILAELTGVITYWYRTGAVFYTQTDEKVEPQSGHKTRSKLVLHPILGLIRRPGITAEEFLGPGRVASVFGSKVATETLQTSANNYGYFSNYSYPTVKQDDEYVIGVFGGSVAQWFSLTAQKELAHLLNIPEYKRLKILNFAQGGFKQPQQLVSLNYFLSLGQHFDMVLNIDGFNEIALATKNAKRSIHPSMPNSQTLIPMITAMDHGGNSLESIELLANIVKSANAIENLSTTANQARFASSWLLRTLLLNYQTSVKSFNEQALEKRNVTKHNTKLIAVTPWPSPQKPEEDMLTASVSLWLNTSFLMSSTLSALEIPYIHLVQPNQYSSNKIFTQEEKIGALEESENYGSLIKEGYELMLNSKAFIGNKGIDVVDATGVFDDVSETVYIDKCCHINPVGNKILATFIAKHINEHHLSNSTE